MRFIKKTMKTSSLYPQAQPPERRPPAGYGTLTAAMAAGSALAANTERGSVPSSTLLSGSTTELEDEDVEEVLPFRLTFLVLDSVTCGNNHGGEMESPPTLPLKHLKGISLLPTVDNFFASGSLILWYTEMIQNPSHGRKGGPQGQEGRGRTLVVRRWWCNILVGPSSQSAVLEQATATSPGSL